MQAQWERCASTPHLGAYLATFVIVPFSAGLLGSWLLAKRSLFMGPLPLPFLRPLTTALLSFVKYPL